MLGIVVARALKMQVNKHNGAQTADKKVEPHRSWETLYLIVRLVTYVA